MKIFTLFMLVLALSACASDHSRYYDSVAKANQYQYEAQKAKYEAEAERYKALASMSYSDAGETARVAAVMGLALAGQPAAIAQPARSVTPAPPEDRALKWAQVLAGPLTNLGLGYFNRDVAIQQSNNSRDVQLGTVGAFTGMGQQIMDGSTAGYEYVNPTPVIAPDPVVVEQPAPVIVPPADPVIVTPPDPIIVPPSEVVVVP